MPVPTTINTNQTVDRIDQNIGDKIRLYARADYQNEHVFGGSADSVNAATTPVTDHELHRRLHAHADAQPGERSARGPEFLQHRDAQPLLRQRPDERRHRPGNPRLQRATRIYNNPGIPDFNITGFNGLTNGSTNWYQNDSTTQLSEQISWNHGSHNIMAGLEFRRLATGRAAVNSARGAFTFNGTLTGYAPADFILGLPSSFTTPGPEVRGRTAEWRDGFFVTDKWQVSRKFTIDYGIRYELPTVAYTINGVATELNPNQTALVGGTPGFHFTAPNHTDWAPRVGFAYRITEKTVFRAGGGIYYNPNQTNSYTFLNTNPPYTTILTCSYSVGLTPSHLDQSVQPPGVCPTAPTAGTIVTDPWHQPTPRMNQWSAGLERQLWSGGGFEVQYLGSHSYHLDRSFYNNTPLAARTGLRQFAPAQSAVWRHPHHQRRRNRQLREHERHLPPALDARPADARQLHLVAHAGRHHGLQRRRHAADSLRLERRLRQLQLGYPPPFRRQLRLRHSVLRRLESGLEGRVHQVAGQRHHHAPNRHSVQRHHRNRHRQHRLPAAPTGRIWFTPPPTTADAGIWSDVSTPTAFTVNDLYPITPTNYAYGNAGRNLLHGPGAETVNFSLFKNFPIRERLKLQFRFETFALFNHSNFGNPSATFNTSSFGNITTLNPTAPGSRVIQFALKLQF